MFNEIILNKAKKWFGSSDCKITPTVEYIRNVGFLRETQIEAIEIYLFLKIAGENKPLWQLLSEGFFSGNEDLSKLYISEDVRMILEKSKPARSIFEFFRQQNDNRSETLSDNEKLIVENIDTLNFEQMAKDIFYGVEYTDYLFSLPMGAGKTFLMASLMYLDLYFAQTEPNNKLFAHNFLILIPSGLKSSIIPSLKTIENFDPSRVIPEPSASNLKRLIKFEVLDESKTAKKSNKAKNPNVQKIAAHQPFDTLQGLIMVVNAEKVILDRLELSDQLELIEKTEDEKDAQANELRNFIGKIPNLQIHIDEVHHATDSDIKLRQTVNKWNARGNVNSVIGFSGTPFLEKKEDIKFNKNLSFNSTQITNTIYYYPLLDAIKTFLKKPTIKAAQTGLSSLQIVEKGVEDFYKLYSNGNGTIKYGDGTNAKLAIYCGSIERLEDEIYPFLTDKLKIPKENILKYHKGNKQNKAPKDSELEFRILDTAYSSKEIILLVQIGKEGWDCRSLTGVILSQKGDSPLNMVLQTSCRCLRQVERGKEETALIWLNEDNEKLLQKQLQKKQQTSIAEINSLGKTKEVEKVQRKSRLEHLKLPEVDFYQLKVEYNYLISEDNAKPNENIANIKTKDFHNQAIITQRDSSLSQVSTQTILDEYIGESANFNRWLFEISRGSFGLITLEDLKQFETELKSIFADIIIDENGSKVFNSFYDLDEIKSKIRLAFHTKRKLETESEIIPQNVKMLIVEKLSSIAETSLVYPKEKEVKEIIEIDESGLTIEEKQAKLKADYEKALKILKSQNIDITPGIPQDYSLAVKSKDRSFHFLPYKFDSKLEKWMFEEALKDSFVQKCNLEVYFNGEKDITDFRIKCYTAKDNYIGLYTPDFMIIQRKDEKIHRALIVETKGSGFAEQSAFKSRRKFVEDRFLKMNNEKFGYQRFDYLYITDADSENDNTIKFSSKLKDFFCN